MSDYVSNTRTCVYAVSGDIRAHASPTDKGDVGVVYIQERRDDVWATTYAFLNPTPNTLTFFGATIYMVGDGKFVLIGGTRIHDGVYNCGLVNVYEQLPGNVWVQVGCIPVSVSNGEGMAFDETLFMSDDRRMVVVGGGGGDVLFSGVVYNYDYRHRSWLREFEDVIRVPEATAWCISGVMRYSLLCIVSAALVTVLYFL